MEGLVSYGTVDWPTADPSRSDILTAQVYVTMTDHTILPLEAHDNKSVFLEHAWNIGRAYRNQALELISICILLSRIMPPKLVHEDAELRR
jgi:hypothetical protein